MLSVEYKLVENNLVRRLYERADPTRRTPKYETVLLEGVERVELGFVDGGVSAPLWDFVVDAGIARLPDAVQVRIDFETGETLSQSFLVGGRT